MPPDVVRRLAANRSFVDETDAVASRSADLLVSHGILRHGCDDLRPDPGFVMARKTADGMADNRHAAVMEAV